MYVCVHTLLFYVYFWRVEYREPVASLLRLNDVAERLWG
jgi:hypothetical protein